MKPSFEIKTEIIIHKSVKATWQVLMDWKNYPNWNPFILGISFHPKTANYLVVNIQGMKFEPKIIQNQPPFVFEWLGKLYVKGLFDGNHRFELLKISEQQTKLVHTERFNGWLVPLLKKQLLNQTKPGFEAMNKALKSLVENR